MDGGIHLTSFKHQTMSLHDLETGQLYNYRINCKSSNREGWCGARAISVLKEGLASLNNNYEGYSHEKQTLTLGREFLSPTELWNET